MRTWEALVLAWSAQSPSPYKGGLTSIWIIEPMPWKGLLLLRRSLRQWLNLLQRWDIGDRRMRRHWRTRCGFFLLGLFLFQLLVLCCDFLHHANPLI